MLGSDIALALRMLVFAYEHLDYPICPTALPEIVINPSLEAHGRIEFGFFTTIKLKAWDRSAYWQSVLVHELTHWLQYQNNESFQDTRRTEREALGCQVAWLLKIGAPAEAYPSEKIILALTGEPTLRV